ncbi:2OG-Fe(II) oxygenase [Backusella circina FSU 941]|nr:2OG-Fe(II) oxygenase [Backusella circina FSU 941]
MIFNKDYKSQVPGLILIEDFITEQEEACLVSYTEQGTWSGLGIGPNPELKRRTQQYGHLFSYRYRKVMEEYGPLPDFATLLVDRIMENQLMPNTPNHLLINEYNAGQGIMPHTDAPALFGPSILSLSLLSDCIMQFTCQDQAVDIVLPRRSIVVLTGDARYKYKHCISKDLIETTPSGMTIHRDRRISFTFREIVSWEDTKKCNP